jgi:NAD(P)-dependent dehydrogenase (short-subunit alcohol dehydrogenase family)
MNTVAIVGAGPLLGLSAARKWGGQGHRVALIARTKSRIDEYASELRGAGIHAHGWAADARDPDQLSTTFAAIEADLGAVDVLLYSPTEWLPGMTFPPLEDTPDEALNHFRLLVGGAIASVRALAPSMIARGEGTLLFTTGISAHRPIPNHGSLGIANAGLRYYSQSIVHVLAPQGVFVANLSIGLAIVRDGTKNDPDRIADRLYELAQARSETDAVYT